MSAMLVAWTGSLLLISRISSASTNLGLRSRTPTLTSPPPIRPFFFFHGSSRLLFSIPRRRKAEIMVLLSASTWKVWLDQPRIVLKISWKVIENPERGEVYYHYDSTTIMTTIAKDVSCFLEDLDRSMTEIFRRLNVDVPFLSRLPPDSIDKLFIERHLQDGICEAVSTCGSGGFMLRFEITLASDSDQYPYTVITEQPELPPVAMDADPLRPPINQHPRLTPLPTGAEADLFG